jgi:predicted outer membrane repeat protein
MASQTPALNQRLNRASRRKLSKKNSAKTTGTRQSLMNSRNVSLGVLATAGLMTVGMTCAAAGTSTHTTANAFRNAINTATSGDVVQVDAQGVSGQRFDFLTDEALSVTGLNGLTVRGINFSDGTNSLVPGLVRGEGAAINTAFFRITNSSNVVIENIGFGGFQSGVLSLDNSGVTLNHVAFYGNTAASYGAAINAIDSDLIINDSLFVNNASLGYGGAIYANNSDVFIDYTLFVNNDAEDKGGAIFAVDSTVDISDSYFDSNISNNGGAIFAENSNVYIENSYFYDNRSEDNGGAIYAEDGSVDIQNSVFEDNSSYAEGGAIFGLGSDIVISGGSAFFSNSTDAVNAGPYGYYGGEDGGAIFMGSQIVQLETVTGEDSFTEYFTVDSGSLDISYTIFDNNYASGNGGAISLNGTSATLFEVYFINNDADDDGGAIYIEDTFYAEYRTFENVTNNPITQSYVSNLPTLYIDYSIFTSNSSNDNGGAIYAANSNVNIANSQFNLNYAADDGGAIYLDENSVYITNSTFTSNDADDDGGAIYIENDVTLTIISSTFEDNDAVDNGGAVYADADGYIEITDTTFINNRADRGGAIYVEDDSTLSIDDSVFNSNKSYDDGGAIYIEDSSLTILDSSFYNNDADGNGGAIYIDNYSDVTITNTTFYFNSADGDGGAIAINYESTVTIQDSTFEDNSSVYNDGGAIDIYNSSVTILDSVFFSNYADDDGGAISAYSGDLLINYSFFAENGSYDNGGAIRAEYTDVRVYDSLFAVNDAGDNNGGDGGAISIYRGPLLVANSVFYSNTADYNGGAISGYFNTGDEYAQLYVVDSIFEDNQVTQVDSAGGAIHVVFSGNNDYLGDVTIWSSLFEQNSGEDAAAVYVDNADFVDINGSIFNENIATKVMGEDATLSAVLLYNVEQVEIGYTQFYAGGALSLVNVSYSNIFASTFTENSGISGGAIQIGNYMGGPGGYHTLSYNTFVDNDGTYVYYTGEDNSYAPSIFASAGELNLMANVFASSNYNQSQVIVLGEGAIAETSGFNFTTAADSLYAESVTWEDLDFSIEEGVIQDATAGFGMFETDLETFGWRPSRSSVLANVVNSVDVAESIGDGFTIPTSDFFGGGRANSNGESGLETAGALTTITPPISGGGGGGGYTPPPLPPLSHIVIPPAAAASQTLFLVNGNTINGTTSVVNGAIRLAWDSYQVNITPTLTAGSLSAIAADGVLEYVVGDGTTTTVSGFGLLPMSTVHVYILSTPTLLGTFTTDAEGKFTGSLVLPSTMASGKHYLQVNGYSKQSTIASGSVAVRIQRVVENQASSKPITFRVNSSRLTKANKDLLSKLVQDIRSVPGFLQTAKIVVNGSASPEGMARLNSRLAKARANAVVSYLKGLGITPEIIEVTQEDKRSRSAQIQVIYKNKA